MVETHKKEIYFFCFSKFSSKGRCVALVVVWVGKTW